MQCLSWVFSDSKLLPLPRWHTLWHSGLHTGLILILEFQFQLQTALCYSARPNALCPISEQSPLGCFQNKPQPVLVWLCGNGFHPQVDCQQLPFFAPLSSSVSAVMAETVPQSYFAPFAGYFHLCPSLFTYNFRYFRKVTLWIYLGWAGVLHQAVQDCRH